MDEYSTLHPILWIGAELCGKQEGMERVEGSGGLGVEGSVGGNGLLVGAAGSQPDGGPQVSGKERTTPSAMFAQLYRRLSNPVFRPLPVFPLALSFFLF